MIWKEVLSDLKLPRQLVTVNYRYIDPETPYPFLCH